MLQTGQTGQMGHGRIPLIGIWGDEDSQFHRSADHGHYFLANAHSNRFIISNIHINIIHGMNIKFKSYSLINYFLKVYISNVW